MQLETISLCFLTCFLEEDSPQPPCRQLQRAITSPLSLQTGQSQFPQLGIPYKNSLQDLCSRPFTASLSFHEHAPEPRCLSCSEGLKAEHSTQGTVSTVPSKGTMTSLLLLATLFLIQARMPLAFLATRAHC